MARAMAVTKRSTPANPAGTGASGRAGRGADAVGADIGLVVLAIGRRRWVLQGPAGVDCLAGARSDRAHLERAMSRAPMLCTLAFLVSVSGVQAARQTPAPARPAAAATTTEESAIRARANALLAKMTPEEKAGQLTQYFYFTFGNMKDLPEQELKAGRVGSLLFI